MQGRGTERFRLTFAALTLVAWSTRVATPVGFWRSEQDGVIGMCLDVLLEILGALEGLSAEITLVWFQGNVYANM